MQRSGNLNHCTNITHVCWGGFRLDTKRYMIIGNLIKGKSSSCHDIKYQAIITLPNANKGMLQSKQGTRQNFLISWFYELITELTQSSKAVETIPDFPYSKLSIYCCHKKVLPTTKLSYLHLAAVRLPMSSYRQTILII